MKINSSFIKPNFKGYDAVPLKNIYLSELYSKPFVNEMKIVARQEGFEIRTWEDMDRWPQDRKCFLEKNGRPFLIADEEVSRKFMRQMHRKGVMGKRIYGFLEGGDTFIGKYPNGEHWLITGKNVGEIPLEHRKIISSIYNIDEKNIFEIPKQNFHIDMCVRPIGYPYVLVNDFDLVDKNMEKIIKPFEESQSFMQDYNQYKEYLKYNYSSTDEICSSLIEAGFIPIRIAGVYGDEVNFMNGIVNKHSDGTISYITNSSDTGCNNFYKKMQEIFEQELRAKVPNISKIYFIKGKTAGSGINYIMSILRYKFGGIHCMSLEEPDFEAWA